MPSSKYDRGGRGLRRARGVIGPAHVTQKEGCPMTLRYALVLFCGGLFATLWASGCARESSADPADLPPAPAAVEAAGETVKSAVAAQEGGESEGVESTPASESGSEVDVAADPPAAKPRPAAPARPVPRAQSGPRPAAPSAPVRETPAEPAEVTGSEAPSDPPDSDGPAEPSDPGQPVVSPATPSSPPDPPPLAKPEFVAPPMEDASSGDCGPAG